MSHRITIDMFKSEYDEIRSVLARNGRGGVCTCLFPSGTWTAAGTFEGELEFTKSDNNIQTVQDLVKFKVRDDFD